MSANPAFSSDPESVELGEKKQPLDQKNGGPPVVVASNGTTASNGKLADEKEQNILEAAKRAQAKRDQKPLWYCKMITTYPKASFFITLGIHLFLFLIFIILFRVGYDIFPIVFDRLPLDIQNNEDYLRGLSWSQRNADENNILERFSTGDTSNQTELSQRDEAVVWIYYIPNGGNILTQENLQSIKTAEKSLFEDPEYQSKYCYKPDGIDCANFSTILNFFNGKYSYVDAAFNDGTYNDIVNVITKANHYNETKSILANMVGIDFKVESGAVSVSTLRGSMFMGMPLAGYVNVTDRSEEQRDKLDTYLKGDFITLIDKLYQNGVGKVSFTYTSGTLIGYSITSFVFRDMSFLIGSLAFIFLFMWLQTKSLWITGFAILSIVMCFCSTNLVYRIILDFRYVGIFHVLALFIILGIGADDVFVFVDTWKETGHYKFISLAHRMSYCYRRAALAMMYTSLTTAIAFIVSATSPFLGISTFGVFAGLLVCINYMSVIIHFPTVVIMYHVYFEKFKCCCCCPRQSIDAHEVSDEVDHTRKNFIVRFFRGPYHKFITHRVARWIIIVLFIIKIGVFIYFSTTIQVNEESTKFLPESTNIGKYLAESNKFPTGDNPQKVFIVFGMHKQSLASCHKTNASCFGDTVWDNNFNLNDPGAQEGLLNICNTMQNMSEAQIAELHIKKNLVTGKPEVLCFLQDFQTFLDQEEVRNLTLPVPGLRYPTGTDFVLPIVRSDAMSFMDNVTYIYNSSKLSSSYNRWFEIGESFWLNNGFVIGSGISDDMKTYSSMLGEVEDDQTVTEELQIGATSYSYKYGTKLKYAAIVINTTLDGRNLGYPTGLPIKDKWEEYVKQLIASAPNALKGGYQTTPDESFNINLWHWLAVQKTLVSSAVLGIGIGIGLAFPILVLATMNIITGFLATLTIGCVTLSVIGFVPILGWKLGMLESLNLVLVVGLAVDYCVHLAEGYSRSVHTDRSNRVRDALEEVGISVLSGCCTTLGASFFLLFAVILFFTQFGIFLFCTILMSILYSLVFFMTVLGTIGPQNDFGSLRPLFEKCCRCCKKE